ncbi:hypothetical protein GCK32_008082 [Trichostrongylus colubriformis]|uniref:Uncharacterized protein n=1 Tax=Trichostrongylus colubriformis TaxID=6319 RepID=A0AAN8ICA3_TRICO
MPCPAVLFAKPYACQFSCSVSLAIDRYYQKLEMGSRPQSRGETSFPAGNTTISSCTSERLGAFGALQLDYTPPIHPSHHKRMTEHLQVSRPTQLWSMEPSAANNERPDPRLSQENRGRAKSPAVQQQGETPLLTRPYMSSYPSNVSSTGSRRKPATLTDVVSTSGDTADLARNLKTYVDSKIPPAVTICVLIVLSVIAFAMILMGRDVPHPVLSSATNDSHMAHHRRHTLHYNRWTAYLSHDSIATKFTPISNKIA